jgi:hypothetical protein
MAYTFINISREEEPRGRPYWVLWLLGFVVVLVVCFLRWGGYLPVAGDSVPEHVDAAVVLQGSVANENARTEKRSAADFQLPRPPGRDGLEKGSAKRRGIRFGSGRGLAGA